MSLWYINLFEQKLFFRKSRMILGFKQRDTKNVKQYKMNER